MDTSATFTSSRLSPFTSFLQDIKNAAKILTLATLVGTAATVLHPREAPPNTISYIDVRDLLPIIQHPQNHPNTMILDTRTKELYQKGHIPGALNLPQETFEQTYDQLKPKIQRKQLITYCASSSCPTAQTVSQKLAENGEHVQIYKEGWEEWTIMQNPIEGLLK